MAGPVKPGHDPREISVGETPSFTPKWCGPHRRYERVTSSVLWGLVAVVTVFVILVVMFFYMPPLG